nr:hypothetical protein Q903MT_gene2339 [Picea sitchensis]
MSDGSFLRLATLPAILISDAYYVLNPPPSLGMLSTLPPSAGSPSLLPFPPSAPRPSDSWI